MSERKRYNWDLIERLLHEVQNGADQPFTPRQYAQDHAEAMRQAGEPVEDLDALKAEAAGYESLLLRHDYIEPRALDQGGTGENFQLTVRGARLLALIDSGAIPGDEHPREVLDDQHDALHPATFEELAAKAQIA